MSRDSLTEQRRRGLEMILDSAPNGLSRELLGAAGVRAAALEKLASGLLIEARTHRLSNPAIDVIRYHVTRNGEAAIRCVEWGRERAAGEGRLWKNV